MSLTGVVPGECSYVDGEDDDGVDYDDGSDGAVSRPEVRSKVNGDDGRLAAVSRASRRCKTQCSWQ